MLFAVYFTILLSTPGAFNESLAGGLRSPWIAWRLEEKAPIFAFFSFKEKGMGKDDGL